MILERPVVGWGAGEFAYQYLERLGSLLPADKNHALLQQLVFAREAHNDFLQFWSEFGFIGIGLVGWIFWSLVKPCIFSLKEDANQAKIAILWVLGIMMICSSLNFSWQTSGAGPLAGLLLGLLSSGKVPASHPKQPTRLKVTSHGVVWVTLGVLIVGLSGFYWKTLMFSVKIPDLLSKNQLVYADRIIPESFYASRSLLGAAYAQSGEFVKARRVLEKVDDGYMDPLLLNNLGNVYSNMNEWGAAKDVYMKWSSSGIQHDSALSNLSVAQEQLHEYLEAAQTLETQLHLWSPNEIAPIFRLGVLYFQAGEYQDARRVLSYYSSSWKRADAVEQSKFLNLQGAIYLKTGALHEARLRFEEALLLNPNSESAKKNLRLR